MSPDPANKAETKRDREQANDRRFHECGRGFTLGTMGDPRTMSGAAFEAALRELAAAPVLDNLACLACEGCERCRECTFCADSQGLARCHHCTACRHCVDCSNCAGCDGCTACQRCIASEECIGCAYVVRSTRCNGCSYCFGCVGLSRRDFCILNQPYDRATYFEVTTRLAREMRITMPWP
jgi:hypothetical protein